MWIRFVLVPGLTDAADNVAAVADFVAGLDDRRAAWRCCRSTSWADKWAATGEKYLLGNTRAATPEQAEDASDDLPRAGADGLLASTVGSSLAERDGPGVDRLDA